MAASPGAAHTLNHSLPIGTLPYAGSLLDWHRVVYPLLIMSYVMGMLAANLIFHESIPLNRWIGLLLIMAGVILVVQK